jgi:hypothetical protein
MSPTCLHKLNYHYLHRLLHIVKVSTLLIWHSLIGLIRVATSFGLVSTFEHTRLVRVWVFFLLFSFFFSFFLFFLPGRYWCWVLLKNFHNSLGPRLIVGWYTADISLVLPHIPHQTGPSISLVSLRLYPTSMFFSTSTHTRTIYSNNSLEINNNLYCILYPQVFLWYMGLCRVYAWASGLYVLRLYQPCLRTSLIGIWGNTSLVPVLYQFQISISEIYLPHTSQISVFDPIEAGLGWYEKFSKYQVPGLVYSTLDTRGKPLFITFHLTI